MWFTGIPLLLASLAFSGSAADEECKNGTRPASHKDGEGCDYYCMNNSTKQWDHFFYGDGEKCFYKEGNLRGTCKEGICNLDENSPEDNPETPNDGDGDDDIKDDDEEEKDDDDDDDDDD
ncbi:pheromone-processing carboxypeptidase KEX1-like, partial [Ixodes scapularis]|uniref:pheromone-processing carboxypeptidase KEX1-like n=1 Tax=Ixodes scapularis TaxID=6945 RepID=UPI001A9FB07D